MNRDFLIEVSDPVVFEHSHCIYIEPLYFDKGDKVPYVAESSLDDVQKLLDHTKAASSCLQYIFAGFFLGFLLFSFLVLNCCPFPYEHRVSSVREDHKITKNLIRFEENPTQWNEGSQVDLHKGIKKQKKLMLEETETITEKEVGVLVEKEKLIEEKDNSEDNGEDNSESEEQD